MTESVIKIEFCSEEINKLVYLQDVALLFSGYEVLSYSSLFSHDQKRYCLSDDGHIRFKDPRVIGKLAVRGSEEQLNQTWLLNRLLAMCPCQNLEPKDVEKVKIPLKVAYLLFCKGEFEYTDSLELVFYGYPSRQNFLDCKVKDSEVEDFLMAQCSFDFVGNQERKRVDRDVKIFTADGKPPVTVKLLKELNKESSQISKILLALAAWKMMGETVMANTLAELLHNEFKNDNWAKGTNGQCSDNQLEAIELVFLPPSLGGRGKKKKYGNITDYKSKK